MPPSQSEDDWVIVRDFDAAVFICSHYGCPNFISFDNDLGGEKEGYDFAKWLVEQDLDNPGWIPDDFDFYVHSQNPVARDNIKAYLLSYLISQ